MEFLFATPSFQAEEQLESYMNTFDVVLIDDQTMDLPNKLLSLIVANDAK